MIARALVLAVLAVALTGSPAPAEQHHHRAATTVHPVQVTVVDHTRGQWPGMAAAVAGWNASPYVHLTVRAACARHTYCTVVQVGHYGHTVWVAHTLPPRHGVATVQVNLAHAQQAGTTDVWPTAVLCHELGHALGVDHPGKHADPHTRGCITATDPHNITPVATASDLLALAVARNGGRGLGWGAVYSAHPHE